MYTALYEHYVDKDYPSTFVWANADDSLVPASNAVRMGEALKEKGIRHKLNIYPSGEHGCNLGIGTSAEGWMEEMYELMENIKSPEMRKACIETAKVRCRGMISGDFADQV